ncbi:MAG: LCP family protein [Candidatus Falkowbacteria bacterium]|nr:LCP family protein [Candidatus Falkowbacteria bacterium]
MYDNERMLQDLENLHSGSAPAPRRRRFLKFVIGIISFLVLLYGFFYVKSYFAPSGKTTWVDKLPIIGQIKHLAESSERALKGENVDRINILLLGIGGKGHDGAQLTDTIMVGSIKPSTKQVSLLSIPRDLAVPIEGSGWRKVNSVNALAEGSEPGSGGLASSQAIGDLLQAPIDYYVRVDFEGFEKIIDQVGGVDVYVDNTLDDYAYPILGQEDNPDYYSRYEHLHIDTGWQKMDGKMALKYARSRHGVGGEGTDFARAKRQQKILEAVKDKVISANFLLNPSKVSSMIDTLKDNISTNLKVWEIIKLWSFVKDVKSDSIINKVLDNSPSGLLIDARGDNGAYILNPRSGDFSEIQYLFNSIFGEVSTSNEQAAAASKLKTEITISILNGTWVNGLGSRKAVELERLGANVLEISNSSRHNFERSVIYDLTFGAKREELELLKEKTGANIAPTLPDWLKEELAAKVGQSPRPQPDFILVLGTDADTSSSGTENTN